MSDPTSTETAPVEAPAPQVEQPQAAPPSAAPSTVPSIGRIVHYRRQGRRGVEVLAAVILRVNKDESVNLKIMLDSPAPDLYLAGVRQGEVPGSWSWPARI